MQFRKYLSEGSVFLDRSLGSLEEVLEFLAERFSAQTGLDQETLFDLLEEREKLNYTWLGRGTMLPHNHSPLIKDIHMIFIRCSKPFLLEEGKEVRYIFSILTSGSQEQLYLSLLQGIAQLIEKSAAELDRCATPAELFDLLGSSSFLMGAPLNATDLAKPWPGVRRNDNLAAALDLMKKHQVYILPVFTEDGRKLCGVLNLVDLLKAGFPDYVFSLSDFSFIQDFQPVRFFWKNEMSLMVGDFITDYRPYIIRADASYPEIFFLMIKGNRRHLLVLDCHDELVGVIQPMQIIDKMLRP